MNRAKSIGSLLSVVLATSLALPARAQSNSEAQESHLNEVRRTVMQKRDSALSVLLQMSAEQAAAFWPLQKSYDQEMAKLGKTEEELFREFSQVYDKLTAESASKLAKRMFELERNQLALQEKYFNQISQSVTPVIAAQFTQLQRQFETELRMERMKVSPLAKEVPAS